MTELPAALVTAATKKLNDLEDAAERGSYTPEFIVRLVLEDMVDGIRQQIAADIEAVIVTDPPDRYALWPSREGETSYPDACAHAMNGVITQEDYGEWEPVIQAGEFWDALEPVILRAAAAIARHGPPVPSGESGTKPARPADAFTVTGLARSAYGGNSDIQPDPYIDALAAGHVQEYDPAGQEMP